jgi:hypothetical protein
MSVSRSLPLRVTMGHCKGIDSKVDGMEETGKRKVVAIMFCASGIEFLYIFVLYIS